MLVSHHDVLVAQERHHDLLKQAEVHRISRMQAGDLGRLSIGSIGRVAVQAMQWLGDRFVSVGEVMQRRYAG